MYCVKYNQSVVVITLFNLLLDAFKQSAYLRFDPNEGEFEPGNDNVMAWEEGRQTKNCPLFQSYYYNKNK